MAVDHIRVKRPSGCLLRDLIAEKDLSIPHGRIICICRRAPDIDKKITFSGRKFTECAADCARRRDISGTGQDQAYL